MKITIFLDGRAGHEKQSQAVAHELGRLAPVTIHQVVLAPVTVFGRMTEFLQILTRPITTDNDGVAGSDLLIGTGSRTHLVLLAYRKKLQRPIVTCMTPERFLRPWFDLCCVPRHDGIGAAANILTIDGPPVLVKSVPAQRDPARGLILVGGTDERSHTWDGKGIVTAIDRIVQASQNVHWRISSSPRTPEETVKRLQQLVAVRENTSFFHFRDTPRGWVEEQYSVSTYAWVSADSVSMVYEAVTSGCKVGIVPVQWHDEQNKFVKSFDFLVQAGLVVLFVPGNERGIEHCGAGTFNEAQRCAVEIMRRFFPARESARDDSR
ncbi:MAG: mitochondrial fission ELM1 family protein [Desulfopila sp.]